tara:strand:+ start:815 stop:1354 length:540 start_codon:yes stop_codon:yes gene_type:complete
MNEQFESLEQEEKIDAIFYGMEALLSRIEALEDNQGRAKSQAAPIKKKSKIEAYIKSAFLKQRNKWERQNAKRFNIPMDDVISYFMSIESFVENFNTWNETGDDDYKPTIYSDGEEESMSSFHTSTLGKWREMQELRKEQKRNANIAGGKPSRLAPDGSTWSEYIKKQREQKGLNNVQS